MRAQAQHIVEGETPERFIRIRERLLSSPTRLCTERAVLITEYFKKHDDRSDPLVIRKAKALRYLLRNKSVRIFDDELIVGNPGKWRKSVLIQPELAGVFMCEELLWMERRKTTPLSISWPDRAELLISVIPYWLFRNMNFLAFKGRRLHMTRFLKEQLTATAYIINESGGRPLSSQL